MKVIRQTPLRMITPKPHRQRKLALRLEQPEDPELTHSQKIAIINLTIERSIKPILQGKVDIRDVLTPPGGWARLEARYPNLRSLPVAKQLELALHG